MRNGKGASLREREGGPVDDRQKGFRPSSSSWSPSASLRLLSLFFFSSSLSLCLSPLLSPLINSLYLSSLLFLTDSFFCLFYRRLSLSSIP
jgi:hypothetical protein